MSRLFNQLFSNPYAVVTFLGAVASIVVGLLFAKRWGMSLNRAFRLLLCVCLCFAFAKVFSLQIPIWMRIYVFIFASMALMVAGPALDRLLFRQAPYFAYCVLLSAQVFLVFSSLGCAAGGCCHGYPYDGLFSIVYQAGSAAVLKGIPVLPVQYLGAALAALCLPLAYWVIKHCHYRSITLLLLWSMLNFCYYFTASLRYPAGTPFLLFGMDITRYIPYAFLGVFLVGGSVACIRKKRRTIS